jgi:hypothetical protein
MKLLAPLCCLASLLFSGCVKGLDKTSRVPFAASEEYMNRSPASTTLFPTDEAVLGGANIEQILASKTVFPRQARLVVLPFETPHPTWNSWSEELSEAERNLHQTALAKLRGSARVAEVSLLPSLMVPQKQTIPYLREAAARFQAELLLVYRARSRVYEKYRIFQREKVKSKCVVEAILLDVRTGIVPFSSQSIQEYETKRSGQDYGLYETAVRAEMRALKLGLEEVAGELVSFLETVPAP